jgi:hypothetical protein
VHTATWSNIYGKRFYLAEQAPICAGMPREEFRCNANTVAAEELLKDEYVLEQLINAATQEQFKAIAEIRKGCGRTRSQPISHIDNGQTFGANPKKRPCPLDPASTLDTILREPCQI